MIAPGTWPHWRVKLFGTRVRVDNGKGELRPGEIVVWEGDAASIAAALAAAAEQPLALDVPAFAPFRGVP